jgi:drug/metabolite transporter (DMT)-like permease
MSDQTPLDDRPAEPPTRREERHERLPWLGGAILIVLGIVFLLQNTESFNLPLRNWWALFILIPAISALDRGWRAYKREGNTLSPEARSAFIGAAVLLLLVVMFLFELNWGIFGPVLLILVGVGILLGVRGARKQ